MIRYIFIPLKHFDLSILLQNILTISVAEVSVNRVGLLIRGKKEYENINSTKSDVGICSLIFIRFKLKSPMIYTLLLMSFKFASIVDIFSRKLRTSVLGGLYITPRVIHLFWVNGWGDISTKIDSIELFIKDRSFRLQYSGDSLKNSETPSPLFFRPVVIDLKISFYTI